MGLCPICLGLDGNSLTLGLPAAALVLLTTVVVVLGAFARVVYRVWKHETP